MSVAREALMLNKPDSAVSAINTEDLLIYLRWLVCHFHSVKRFNQFLKVNDVFFKVDFRKIVKTFHDKFHI